MKVAIRVDASTQIGSGHLFRCLTLADSLQHKGFEVHFLCRDLTGFEPKLILSRGHAYHVIQATKRSLECSSHFIKLPHSHWLPCSQPDDFLDCREILMDLGPIDLLIIDHYALDHTWQSLAKSYTRRLMVIDDLADRHHICDLLLDQNYYRNMQERYLSLTPDRCVRLLGPNYALLRPEFALERLARPRQNSKVQSCFVFFGGSDSTNETLKTLEALKILENEDIAIQLVIGTGNPHRQRIVDQTSKMRLINVHNYVKNVAELMTKSDLAIGAGGSSVWERFCLGLPALVTSIAENQIESCEYLNDQNLIIYLGYYSEVTKYDIAKNIVDLQRNPAILKEISTRTKKIVDGLGTDRVCQSLIELL